MTGNRLLFWFALSILGLLVVGMLILATGTPAGPSGLGVLVQTVVGIGLLLLILRLLRQVGRR